MLESLPFPVVMIPGNHDCLTEAAIYRRYDFNAISNVTLINDEQGDTIWVEALGVSVWGQGMHEHTPDNEPLAGMPESVPERTWNLGLGHGIYVEAGGSTLHSSPIHAEQIAASGFDYLALGSPSRTDGRLG